MTRLVLSPMVCFHINENSWIHHPPNLVFTKPLNQKMWDNDKEPDTEDMDWEELSKEQQKAAEVLGYNKKTWDES